MTLVLGEGPEVELGEQFVSTLTEAEARYLMAHEWAQTADDLLFRRTKHGVHMSEVERNAFANWMARTV